MTLHERFRAAAIGQSLSENTIDNYGWWHLKFYRFCKVPASQWTGELVRRWMVNLYDLNYSAVSRKQALCAVKFVFDFVLKRELGQLDLPPMPRVRKTLRTIPSRELLGHEDLNTTAIYLHADAAKGVSPLDALPVRPKPMVRAAGIAVIDTTSLEALA